MEIKTLEELIKAGTVNHSNILLRLPLPRNLADVMAIIFPNFLELLEFKEAIASKINFESMWSAVAGLGKGKGVLLLFGKNTIEKHIRPLLS